MGPRPRPERVRLRIEEEAEAKKFFEAEAEATMYKAEARHVREQLSVYEPWYEHGYKHED